MTFSVRLSYPDGANPLARFRWTQAATEWADDMGPRIRSALQEEAPVRSGRLRSSIRYSRSFDATQAGMEFSTNVPYAGYVKNGTAPHLIRPVAARSLHWVSGGHSHFARVVHHPGTRANDFPRRALEPMKEEIQQSFRDAVSNAMGGS